MNKWVRIKKFCDQTGETDDAVRSNIASGRWIEGRHWALAPDGKVMIHKLAAKIGLRGHDCEHESIFHPLTTIKDRAIPLIQMPVGAGVYFLFYGAELHYVGQAINLMRRIGQHMYEELIPFNRISWVYCDRPDLLRLENAYISILRPAFNRRGRE